MFEIEKGHPIPEAERGKRNTVYPFLKMDVGDSFAVPLPEEKKDRDKILRNIYSSIQHYKKKYEVECRTKQMKHEGKRIVRVWRIK